MMDATHKFSRRKLKLFTILVIGPYEKGIPMASLVCNRMFLLWRLSSGALRLVDIKTFDYFMSDDNLIIIHMIK